MTQKFGRNFRLTIDPKDGKAPIVVTMPFTVRFWMKRDQNASLNFLSIDIFNLSEANRRRLYQDRFDLNQNVVNGVAQGARHVLFEIGYASNLSRIFDGNVFSVSSSRDGTNVVTRIECMTGLYDIAAAQSNITLQAGQTYTQVFTALINQFSTLKIGKISPYWDTQKITSPVTLSNDVWYLIQQYSNGRCYIDNDLVYVMQDNEVITLHIPTFDSSTGILETPRREYASLFIATLLEPSIQVGQLVNISSQVEPVYNGQYKVIGIQHQGVISGARSGQCRSNFILLAPNYFPGGYKKV